MANATNPANGAANASVPSLWDLANPKVGGTYGEMRACISDENFIKKMLATIGKAGTPENIDAMRRGFADGCTRTEARYNKAVTKELTNSEKKDEAPDVNAIAEKSAGKVCSKERTMKWVKLEVTGSCSSCGIKAAELGYEQNKTLQKCARCKEVMYCSRECQKAHWPTHKPVCKLPSGNKS